MYLHRRLTHESTFPLGYEIVQRIRKEFFPSVYIYCGQSNYTSLLSQDALTGWYVVYDFYVQNQHGKQRSCLEGFL